MIKRVVKKILNSFLFRKIKPGTKKIAKQRELVLNSTFFDLKYYLENYPDLVKCEILLIDHFIMYGGFEYRNPSEKFDTKFYSKEYPDVSKSHLNPLIHYLTIGSQEGRRCHPIIESNVNDDEISPEIYIHIGQSKTGTSAIQAFLNTNREILASKYGVLYPNFNNSNPGIGNWHNHSRFFTKTAIENRRNELIKSVNKSILFCRKNNLRKIILSSEGILFNREPSLLRQICDELNIECKIICYIRRQDLWLEAAWKQWGHKKTQFVDIHEYSKIKYLDYHKALSKLSDEFGKENILLRVYDKRLLNGNIVDDFLSIFNIENNSQFRLPENNNLNINSGTKKEVVELMEVCKGLLSSEKDKTLLNFLDRMLSDRFKKKPFETYGFFSDEERKEILEKYSESNRKINQEFFGERSGNLFEEIDIQDNIILSSPDNQKIEKFIPIIIDILMNQQKMIDEHINR